MKILLVDNGTSYLPQLQGLLAEHSLKTTPYSEIDIGISRDFDVIILSGGHDFPVVGNEEKLEKEAALVKNSEKPILGICFGFELIAHVFGASLKRMEEKEHGVLRINIQVPDELFLNVKSLDVFESHRWVVKNIGNELIALANSKDGIEVIKHKTRPVYAVQFHPEMLVEKSCGDEIFNNFLDFIGTK